MLVLSRRLGETIHIGDDITVTVVYIDRGKVRLGIKAPRSVPVDREEVAREKSHPVEHVTGDPVG